MARSKKAEPGQMVTVAEGISRRDDWLIVRVWNPAKNGKGGKDNHRVRISDFANYRAALAEAKRVKQREEDKIKARSAGSGREETVESWARRWQDVVPRTRQEATRRHNEERVRAFVEDFGPRKLRDVSRAEAQTWIVGGPALDTVADTARDWNDAVEEADGTVVVRAHRGNLAAVRAMFTDAQSIGLVDNNPFAKLGLEQSEGRRKIVTLRPEEVDKLQAIAGRVHGLYGQYVFAMLIKVAAWTGLRPGELFGLWPEHVDLEAKRIYVLHQLNAKTRKISYTKTEGRGAEIQLPDGRTGTDAPVPLLEPAEAAFRALDIEQLPKGEPIFRTTHGKPYTQRNHHYYWDPVRNGFAASLPPDHWLPRRIAEKGKLGNLDFYELRHFFGTQLGERGVSPYDIARAMGHQDGGKLAMERYIHTDADAAADRVLQAFTRAA